MKNQYVIITGASSGIGFAIAQKMLQLEARVALIDKNIEPIKHLQNPNATVVELDITNQSYVENTIGQLIKSWGKVDVLINAAGITGQTNTPTHELPVENIRQVFEVNFWGALYMTKAVLPIMLTQNYGRILHIASIAGKEGNPGMLGYSTSKAAVIGMAKAQGKEYAETGITINALAPAVIMTPLVDALPEATVKYMTDKIPMKRAGTLTEVADLVSFIVSPQNSFTTGFCYDLSGGRATY